MPELRTQYNKIMVDLCSKGLAGIVKQIDPDYPTPTPYIVGRYTAKNEKRSSTPVSTNKNERAAAGQTAARLPTEVTH